jgi:hypothetical protein
MQKTKKIVGFVVEVYELKTYWSRDVPKKRYNLHGEYSIVSTERCLLTVCNYNRTYYNKFNSVSKMNKALGLKKGVSYFFYNNINKALKGRYGFGYSIVEDAPTKIWIVRQLHELDNNYQFKF